MNLVTVEIVHSKQDAASVRKCAGEHGNFFARKQLSPLANAIDTKRFAEEVTILSRLNHPNVIKVIDYKLTSTESYFVMPWYAMSLRELFNEENNEIDPSDMQRIFLAVLDAINYAHSQGVLHRDIKPENILLGMKDEVVVSDFGLGLKLDHSDDSRLTYLPRGAGTPWYVAPEQAVALHNATEKSDIFSLGKLLSEFFVKRNYSGEIDYDALPPQYRRIVKKCTEYRAVNRYSSVAELRDVFRLASATHDRHSELHELRQYAIASNSQVSDSALSHLSNLLNDYSDDAREMESFFMHADESLLHRLEAAETVSFIRVLDRWLSIVAQQRYPFDHTDKLASRLRRLYDIVHTTTLKATIISTMLRIGSSHNRFYVLRLCGKTIAAIKDIELSDAIASAFAHLLESERQSLLDHMDVKSIPVGLRLVLRKAA